MGGEEFSSSYRDQLEREIEDSFSSYRQHNEGKNLFKAANTPITLGAVSMVLYVLSQVRKGKKRTYFATFLENFIAKMYFCDFFFKTSLRKCIFAIFLKLSCKNFLSHLNKGPC